MKAKEKAFELVAKYANGIIIPVGFQMRKSNEDKFYEYERQAKQCALIAVDEILEELSEHDSFFVELNKEYWIDVKQEIEKL